MSLNSVAKPLDKSVFVEIV